MSTISLRVSEEELKLFQDFAKLNQISLSELIRRTMLSKLEDEYDLQVFSAHEAAKAAARWKATRMKKPGLNSAYELQRTLYQKGDSVTQKIRSPCPYFNQILD